MFREKEDTGGQSEFIFCTPNTLSIFRVNIFIRCGGMLKCVELGLKRRLLGGVILLYLPKLDLSDSVR